MYAFLGVDAGASAHDGIDGKARIEVKAHPEREDVREVFRDVIAPTEGIWDSHAKADTKPTWVASDDADLAQVLASYYGCPIREALPEGEKAEYAGTSFVQSITTTLAVMAAMLLMMLARPFLRTNAGIDWQAGIMGNTTAAAANFMALSATSGELATHTALAGEITTASGGLIRKGATYAHTGGTTTYTLTATFTANGSDALPVSVVQIGVFNASSSGTMAFEKTVTSATFTASGDAVTYTYTVTP